MDTVKIWEEDVLIPTYEIGEPDKNPMFLEKRVYQGSSGKIYPYPTTEKISNEKKDKLWRAVYLENEYLKIMILPQLGGRIQRAYDKTNEYDFVYYNQVIKPALVGLVGPWISGGIEFNWPQHHRPTTYMPLDYQLKEHADGSKTLLVNDVDQMYGTKGITSFTLYPGKAYIEVGGQLYNRTSLPQTFLWWANPAVAVNDYTQSIFPPDVHTVYDHGKRDVSRFPIAKGVYYKHDYSEGVDISRYKNIPVPTSYMAECSDFDFVGGYDYQKEAGLLHVADHHFSPGKKQWTWGCGEFGKAWDRNLTDEDGPYIELMTGVYTENQPDFTWLKPFEEKSFKQYFMPYKKVGVVKNATIHAALGVEQEEQGVHVTVYATQLYEHAQIIVTNAGKEVCSKMVKLSPVDVYEESIEVALEKIQDLGVSVYSDGKLLVSYRPVEDKIPELGQPAEAAKQPEEIMTNEELLLTAQHIEQHRHATYLPDPYYLEGLKRDPGDSRINQAYGMLLLRRGCFEEAEKYFRTAIKRLTWRSPNPYNSEVYYDLGLALFYQQRFDEAYDAFYKAAIAQMEHAFVLDQTDTRVFLELDQLYKKTGIAFELRLRNFEEHMDIIAERDDAMLELVTLYNLVGDYQKAYNTIMAHQFRPWEGAEGRISGQYKIALVQMAKAAIVAGDHEHAEQLLTQALEYPLNLGEGRLEGTKDNHIYYYLGKVKYALGKPEESTKCMELAQMGEDEPAGAMYYYDQPADMILYKGLAKLEVGDKKGAYACFNKLMDYGERHLYDEMKNDFFAVSLPDFLIFDDDMNQKNKAHCHYLMGLANLGFADHAEAKKQFEQALTYDYNHQNCRIYLEMCEN
ncbi:MAG: DUF5107 domain-containing protein [Eubacterium sp.]|nr:DUF5107 domain-containing protein [Eubacterium sp.]